MSTRIIPIAAVLIVLAAPAAAQSPAATIEPGLGIEPGAMQPVMDQAIFAHAIFNQLEGRWNGSNHRISLGWTGMGRHRLRQALDQIRGYRKQWGARRQPAAVSLQPRGHDLFRSAGRTAQ